MRSVLAVAGLTAVLGSGCGDTGDPATASPTVVTATSPPEVSPPARPTTTGPATTVPTLDTVTTTTAASAPPAPVVDLRAVGWADALRSVPELRVDDSVFAVPGFGPYVEHRAGAAGYTDVGGVVYADLDGDGREEALVELSSGGSAGGTGVLVFKAGPSGPVLVGGDDFYRGFGYKTTVSLEGPALRVVMAVGAGWEPNCCWSGVVERRFRLDGDRMVEVGSPAQRGVPEARVLTIERFYELIAAGGYSEAYDMLTPAAQSREPFDRWRAGFATTVTVRAEVDASTAADPAAPLRTRIVATDRTPSGEVTHTFSGTWRLTYSPSRQQWLLDEPSFQPGG